MAAGDRLFYDSFEDAVRHVVALLGGAKEAGHLLWPTKDPNAARTRLLDCLNPKEPDKLAPDEIVALARAGRDAGCHAIVHWLCAEAGYNQPAPIAPGDEAADLERQAIAAIQALDGIVRRFERAKGVR
jgi:hypothetical protein